MRIGILALALIGAKVAFAEVPLPSFAPSRFVTVVQCYGGAGVHWRTWAIQAGMVTVYDERGTGGLGNLLGTFPITKPQEMQIRSAAAAIRREMKGRMWFSPDVVDGISLSVRFTRDGTPHDDEVVLDNVWKAEFRQLCFSISSVLPPELKITYEDILREIPQQERLAVVMTTVAERHARPKEKKPWWRFW